MQDATRDKPAADPCPIEDLLQKARDGCPAARQELITRWLPHFLAVVRRQLGRTRRLRTIFDSDDFLQETRTALHCHDLDPGIFASPAAFVRFVQGIAMNKVRESQRKHLFTEKRDLNREYSLDSPAVDPERDLAVRDRAADVTALAEEQFQRLLQGRPLVDQCILCLRRNGQSYAAIAQAMGLHEKAIQRFFAQVGRESQAVAN